MCGVVGVSANHWVGQAIFDALTAIQHRGQDAAGILTFAEQTSHLIKGNGLVRDVVGQAEINALTGKVGIGHVRYPTAGTERACEAQPFYLEVPRKIGLVHNGNLVNADALRAQLIKQNCALTTESDSELLLHVFAQSLEAAALVSPDPRQQVFKALEQLAAQVVGAYAVVALLPDFGLLAFRDPQGIRPLVWGQQDSNHLFASESVAMDALGYTLVDDVGPGEAILVEPDGRVTRQNFVQNPQRTPCLFEYIYLARPDSVMDGISVYQARLAMGRALGQAILRRFPNPDIDVVIPIPETSRTAALPVAQALGVDYREGFVKNPYIGRTFIMPDQQQRQRSVRQKLNTLPRTFAGKNVLLVDDSIVRGTTSRQVVAMAKAAGAKRVYFASVAPAVAYQNVYGIDMPTREELIAYQMPDEADLARWMGVAWVVFQTLPDLKRAVQQQTNIQQFEDSVFSGQYATGAVTAAYLAALAKTRGAA